MALQKQFVQGFTTAFIDVILAHVLYALAGISIFGVDPFAGLTAWADELMAQANQAIASAATANNGVAATNSQLSLTGATAVHVSGSDPTADATVPYASCQQGIAVTSTQAIIGFDRISRPAQREVVTWSAYVSGTCTLLVFNVYKLDPVTGDLNNVFTTTDQSALLTGSYTVNQFTFSVSDTQPVTYGDVYAVEAVMAGSGTVYLLGLIPSHAPGPMPSRPYQMGGFRNPAVLATSPAQIPAATMDANYVKNVPWFTFGSQANPSAAARVISDNFQNGTANWLLQHAGGTSANMIMSGGQATFNGTGTGGQIAVNNTPLLTDDIDCAFTVNIPSSAYYSNLNMCSDQNANAFLSLKVEASALIVRNVYGGFYSGAYTDLYSASGLSQSGTTSFYVTYRSATTTWNFYRGSDASGTPFFSCPDPSGFTHGAGHRYFGLMIENTTIGFISVPGSPIVDFMAKDV